MPDTLTVAVNPEGMHTLTVPERFETRGAFDVVLENHGDPTHVYLNLDDGLSGAATLDATNYYVEHGETLPVTISVSPNVSASGELMVATAYGSEKRLVSISVEPTEQRKQAVEIDESLTSPAGNGTGSTTTQETNPSSGAPTQSISTAASSSALLNEHTIRRTLPAVVFGAVALILALSSLLVTGTPRIVLGLLAVLAGILVTVYLALV